MNATYVSPTSRRRPAIGSLAWGSLFLLVGISAALTDATDIDAGAVAAIGLLLVGTVVLVGSLFRSRTASSDDSVLETSSVADDGETTESASGENDTVSGFDPDQFRDPDWTDVDS